MAARAVERLSWVVVPLALLHRDPAHTIKRSYR